MAHQNLKIQKKKEYNPLRARTLRTFKIGKISGYIKKVVPNPRDIFGREKVAGMYYAQTGHKCAAAYYGAERFDPEKCTITRSERMTVRIGNAQRKRKLTGVLHSFTISNKDKCK